MLQFVLCDDNKNALSRICNHLKDIFNRHDMDACISFATTNPNKLFEYAEKNKVNVLILDIDLSSEITGIDLAKKIRSTNKDVYIIFLTAHFEYSMLAYKVKTFDFLVKPISATKLEETILRLYEDIYDNSSSFVKLGNGKQLFKVNDILYIEKDKSKAIVHTINSLVQIYGTFDNIMSCLPEYFIRCNKSYIINVQMINHIDGKNHTIFINNEAINYSNKYINDERMLYIL